MTSVSRGGEERIIWTGVPCILSHDDFSNRQVAGLRPHTKPLKLAKPNGDQTGLHRGAKQTQGRLPDLPDPIVEFD